MEMVDTQLLAIQHFLKTITEILQEQHFCSFFILADHFPQNA